MIIKLLFKLVSRIQFLLISTNQHGVHSPFVFDFVTKGLYQKSRKLVFKNDFLILQKLSKKEVKILTNICNYFNIEQVLTNFKELENNLDEEYKILFINNINNFKFDKILSCSSKTIFVFHGINTHPKSAEKWRLICQNKQAIVTIDLYYFGLIFFRREQEKEHFKIRV